MKPWFLAVFCAVAASLPAAQDGGQSQAWTKLGLGARSAGIGRAVSALKDDVGATLLNPALLATQKVMNVGSQLAVLPDGRQINYLGIGSLLGPRSDWAMGLGYTQYGLSQPLERRKGNTPEADSTFSEGASSFQVGWGAWAWAHRLSLGLDIKVLNHSLGDASATGLSMDLGAFGQAVDWLDWGWVLRDPFSRVAWNTDASESLPLQSRLGVALHWPGRELHGFLELAYRQGQTWGHYEGVEGWLLGQTLGLRAGFEDGQWRLGLGARWKMWAVDGRLDYALGSEATSEGSFQHRFSLDLGFPL